MVIRGLKPGDTFSDGPLFYKVLSVQHLGDTVYHCVSQCDDRVYASKTDAVDQV